MKNIILKLNFVLQFLVSGRAPFATKQLSILLLSFIFLTSSCNKKVSFKDVSPIAPAESPPVKSPPAPLVDTPLPDNAIDIDKLNGQCVQVFYDSSADPTYKFGRTHALMLTNLLGHFPEYQRIVGPIELYKKGNLERCHATFYIGAVYNNVLPVDFLLDYKTTTRQIVWLGYNFWQLGSDFESTFGYKDYIFTTLDYTNRTSDGKPGFFRDILYKGETFPKFSTWSSAPPPVTTIPPNSPPGPLPPPPAEILVAAFEVTKLSNKTTAVSEIMAETKNSFTNEIIPWAIKAGNKFYVAETPFSFIHEADRYFVFADLIFDFLKVAPKHNSKNALLRLEDIHAYVELNYLDEAVQILKSNSVIPHISIIPIFKDPLFSTDRIDKRVEIRMEEVPDFITLIQRYKAEGSVFIWHGVTHQYHDIKNPFTGASGDDYEFWDITKNSPVAEDSLSFVLEKLNNGFDSLAKFSINPKVWLTPHYHASALDDVLFGEIFKWIVGRGVYSDPKITGLSASGSLKPINFDLTDISNVQKNRLEYFQNLKVSTAPEFKLFGQLFSYEIYGNINGENVIPENLGNIQPYLSNQVVNTRNVDKVLEDAKRNLVLRDVWASVFYHPFLLDPLLNSENVDLTKPKDLDRLVKGLKTLGYKFVNLDEYAASSITKKANPKIEMEDLKK